jgi:hypothetical protein
VSLNSPAPALVRTSARVGRIGAVALFGVVAAALPEYARAADAPVAATPVADDQHGLVVLGIGSSVDVTWPLARSIYADGALRPPTLDEAHARVLVGEAPGDSGAAELRDLADTRAAVHGDDAASRRLLLSIALSLHVKGVVVVEAGATPNARPSARVFVTTSSAYDPVHYDPDPAPPVTWGSGAAAASWTGAARALHRSFGDAPLPPPPAPTPAAPPAKAEPPAQGISVLFHPVASSTTPAADGKAEARPFYKSPWFWAAAGAAVFAAGAVYLATRADSSDNIQLQVQVPR